MAVAAPTAELLRALAASRTTPNDRSRVRGEIVYAASTVADARGVIRGPRARSSISAWPTQAGTCFEGCALLAQLRRRAAGLDSSEDDESDASRAIRAVDGIEADERVDAASVENDPASILERCRVDAAADGPVAAAFAEAVAGVAAAAVAGFDRAAGGLRDDPAWRAGVAALRGAAR